MTDWSNQLTFAYVNYLLPIIWAALYFSAPLSIGRSLRALRGRPGMILGAIVVVGAGLRWFLPDHGPGDLQNTVTSAYGIFDPTLHGFGWYGRGPDVLLRQLFHTLQLVPASDGPFVALDFVAGVASVALVAGLMRRLGFGVWACLATAAILAATPMHVRLSPTYNRLVLAMALCFFGWHAILRFLDERRPYDLVVATSALVLAPQFRPEFVWMPCLTIALVVAWRMTPAPDGSERALPRWWWVWLLSYVALVGYPAYWVTIDRVLHEPGIFSVNVEGMGPAQLVHPHHNPFLNPRYTPPVWMLLGVVGAVRGLRNNRWSMLWILCAFLSAFGVVMNADVHDSICFARYHLCALAVSALLVGVGVEGFQRWVRHPAKQAAATVLVAACAAFCMPWVLAPRTVNGEYEFLVEHLAEVPDGCVILDYPEPRDTVLKPFHYISNTAGRQHAWAFAWPIEPEPECVVYYYGANCSLDVQDTEVAETRALYCEQLVELGGEPFARGQAAALTSLGARAIRDPVPLGLYWLVEPDSE